jgi:hypothetical protein
VEAMGISSNTSNKIMLLVVVLTRNLERFVSRMDIFQFVSICIWGCKVCYSFACLSYDCFCILCWIMES